MPSQTFFSPEMRALLVFHFAVRNNTPQFVHDNLFVPGGTELLTIKRLRVRILGTVQHKLVTSSKERRRLGAIAVDPR